VPAVVGVAAAFGGWEVAVVGVGMGSSVLTGFVDCPEPAGLAGLVCFVCWVCLACFAVLGGLVPVARAGGSGGPGWPLDRAQRLHGDSDTGVDTPVTTRRGSRPRLA
jgi:hypothetical protein